ncbi:hypothetical protein DPMN_105664 [Dreissena polymorpha]|uniref:Uncharacterized protein n=1 Tax=Dreissena polymorpha TaxID=45954 RepID=A0A9D4QHX9_DREPO|nr:hypothetical protein DPMN_105664 [Dreissena polymorpha]
MDLCGQVTQYCLLQISSHNIDCFRPLLPGWVKLFLSHTILSVTDLCGQVKQYCLLQISSNNIVCYRSLWPGWISVARSHNIVCYRSLWPGWVKLFLSQTILSVTDLCGQVTQYCLLQISVARMG